jgi:hypothetical protein
MLELQRKYNNNILNDIESDDDKDRVTQNLALCAHAEISALVNAVNFKHHHGNLGKIDRDTILYESVDVVRYIMAIMNVWNIKAHEFEEAFKKKDDYLWMQSAIADKKWEGQPVVLVDIDDVIAEFRNTFAEWLVSNLSVNIDVESEEYYFITALTDLNINPEIVFENFVEQGGFTTLPVVEKAKEFLNHLREEGYWIQLLTARPKDDLRCLYDTFSWVSENNIPYDRIDFSPEKFRWCTKSEYYDSNSIAFAIDDSPKHASEYASHGIPVKVPIKSYNRAIDIENIDYYESFDDLVLKLRRNNV